MHHRWPLGSAERVTEPCFLTLKVRTERRIDHMDEETKQRLRVYIRQVDHVWTNSLMEALRAGQLPMKLTDDGTGMSVETDLSQGAEREGFTSLAADFRTFFPGGNEISFLDACDILLEALPQDLHAPVLSAKSQWCSIWAKNGKRMEPRDGSVRFVDFREDEEAREILRGDDPGAKLKLMMERTQSGNLPRGNIFFDVLYGSHIHADTDKSAEVDGAPEMAAAARFEFIRTFDRSMRALIVTKYASITLVRRSP